MNHLLISTPASEPQGSPCGRAPHISTSRAPFPRSADKRRGPGTVGNMTLTTAGSRPRSCNLLTQYVRVHGRGVDEAHGCCICNYLSPAVRCAGEVRHVGGGQGMGQDEGSECAEAVVDCPPRGAS